MSSSNRNPTNVIDFNSESSDEDISSGGRIRNRSRKSSLKKPHLLNALSGKNAPYEDYSAFLDDDVQFETQSRSRPHDTPLTEEDDDASNESDDSLDRLTDGELGSIMPLTWQESIRLENAIRKRMGFRRHPSQTHTTSASTNPAQGTGTISRAYGHLGDAKDQHSTSLASIHHTASTSGVQNQLEDPLGLVNDNTEGLDEFHYGEKFNPKRFLAKVHKNISYDKLLSGHLLAQKDEFRQKQMQDLVGSNLNRFVKAKDTVVELHDRNILRIEHTETLIRSYIGLQEDSKQLFGKMIKRKKRTEKIKEVLSILKRHQYVFDIPSNIIHNMDRCDYNQVVHDYRKAKNFRALCRERMGITDVPIFVPIFEKIDSQIDKLRQILFRELQLNMHTLAKREKKRHEFDAAHRGSISAGAAGAAAGSIPGQPTTVAPPSTSSMNDNSSPLLWVPLLDEERERIITYLLNLDSPVDPAWYYLDQIFTYIVQTMHSTSKKYFGRVQQMQIAFLIKEEQERGSPKQNSKRSRKCLSSKFTAKELRSIQKLNAAIEHECYKLIRSLGHIMMFYLGHFWTLSENILNNKYTTEGGLFVNSSTHASIQDNMTSANRMDHDERQEQELKAKEKRLEESQSKIRKMLNEIVDCYTENCNLVLEEVDNGQAHQQTLCRCVQSIVKCHYSLEERINIQKSYLATLKKYTFTQHKHIINETWERTIREIASLCTLENWRPISETVQITHLPLLFFNHMKRTLSLLRPFMELKSRNNARSPFFGIMQTHFCSALEAFAQALHDLAFDKTSHNSPDLFGEDDVDTSASSGTDEDGYEALRTPHGELDMEQHTIWGASVPIDEMPSKEQQLILVLRNILHTNNMLIPQLEKLLYVLDTPAETLREEISEFHRSTSYSKIDSTYTKLTTMVLDSFIRRKTIQLLKFVEDAMRNNQLTHRPSGLRTYALEMLLELSLIHSRFENIATGSVNNPQIELRGIIGGDISVTFDSDSDDSNEMNSRLKRRRNRKGSTKRGPPPSNSLYKLPLQQRDETLTTRIFESLCERLAELFMEFLVDSNYETIGENAALQLVIEITFIRKTLKKYESARAKRIYDKIFQLIEQLSNWDPNHKKNTMLIKETLKTVKKQTRLQLESLRM